MIVFIMRGLPGSGKSHISQHILDMGVEQYCSADTFFVDDTGKYNYDPKRIADAHQYCKQKFDEALQTGKPIIVDNTNIKLDWLRYYEVAAIRAGYSVCHVQPANKWSHDPFQCFKKCTHGVPLEKIHQMAKDWECPMSF